MLKIHFLNVGKGNCTIIDFPSGNLSVIDIDNSRIEHDEEVLTDPIEYIHRNFKDRSIFRFVLTHPDMDHMSGLDELARKTSISKTSIINFWDTEHNRTFEQNDWVGSPYDQQDWERYLTYRTSSEYPKCLRLHRGDTSSECCWTQDGIQILSPSPCLVELADGASEDDAQKYNHLSYVLMVEYGGTKVLLGGDASVEAWGDILTECGANSLKADIFLAPHHGSKHNIHEEAFEAIAPDDVVVSVAKGVEYDYEYYSELARRAVFSTKYYGTMRVEIRENGQYLPILVERNA